MSGQAGGIFAGDLWLDLARDVIMAVMSAAVVLHLLWLLYMILCSASCRRERRNRRIVGMARRARTSASANAPQALKR